MLGFKDFFHDSKEIILNVNYRCASKILEKSLLVINENKKRFVKDISSAPNSIEGVVRGKSFESKEEEYKYIAEVIGKKVSNLKYKDIAVIFRTNLEATSMAQFLISKGIPCSYKEKMTFIHDRKEIMDLIAYMSFVNNGNKRSDFLRIMNQPVRYIKRDSLKSETVREADLIAYYKSTANIHMMDTVSKLFRDLKMIGSLRPRLAVHYIRKVVGYDKFVCEKYRNDKARMTETLASLDEFMEMCREYESFSELKDVIEEQNRIKEVAKDVVQNKNGVNIMTMHASKGLEYDTVFIPDLNEGIVPSRKSVSPDAIEEERRMFYVAMTRAKKELHLSYVNGAKDNPVMMSSFLRPIRDVFNDRPNRICNYFINSRDIK
jgi:DNA helicase-2/ATP-dependent DNA helicase PcrA